MKIKVGCCGFSGGKREYFRHYEVVEVQDTFYKPPRVETARRWREQAPEGFEFTLKVWQLITHRPQSPTYRKAGLEIPEDKKDRYGSFQPTDEVFEAWEKTKAIAEVLESRVLVFQCPASFLPTSQNKENMCRFFHTIDRGGFLFVWEPRGDWKDGEIRSLCERLDLVHGVDPFARSSVYDPIFYFRLHGRGGYRYKFTVEDLNCLLEMCRGAEICYCMFNNVYMNEDASKFKGLISAVE